MKTKLNLFCVCVLIALLLSTSTTVSIMFHSFTSAFKAGYESVEKGKDIHISDYKMICTLPTDLLEKTGSVTNVRTGEQASIIPIISMVEAPTKENDTFHALNRIASFISVIAGIFCLLQFFYLIRNINRGDIFSWKNVKFLRKLGWALILLFICTLATIVIGNYEASQVLQLNGCEFSYTFAFSDATLILGFISLLVAEVFAIGLKMKEEQDLTIKKTEQTMNKFRILGVIAIIAIIANFFGGLDENWRDFKKGFEDGHNSAMEIYEPGRHIIPHHATSVKLNVEPLPETTVDSLSNNRVDWTLPYTVTEIETYAKPSAWHILVMGLAIPGIFLFLIGFCSLIRLLISISRREVFTSANVRRLRWFAYTSASLEILIAVDEWIVGNAAVEQISLPGYKIISYAGYSPDWVAVIIPILFAEIFAIGAKMKEEQDLTI